MDSPNYRKLIVWQKAHQNALDILKLLDDVPLKYSRIISQCIAAATSVGANIAEGNSLLTEKGKKRYFEIALSSSYEFDNWLQILKDSASICFEKNKLSEIEKQNIEVIKILNKFVNSVLS